MKFSSKDFGKINSILSYDNINPETLIHKNVANQIQNFDSKEFSNNRDHFVNIVNLPSKSIGLSLGKLKPNQSTRKHRHNYETILYILEGEGKSIIEGDVIYWSQGDAVYVPIWAWHQHCNTSTSNQCSYLACENAPLLQNLGELALREES